MGRRKRDTVITTSAQVSIYPLGQDDLSPAINEALDIFRKHRLEVQPGTMGTIIAGGASVVFASLEEVYRRLANDRRLVMVATLSNACPRSL
jgi:uncharacterized protein YqgV (UPF0045/DUF77 family)